MNEKSSHIYHTHFYFSIFIRRVVISIIKRLHGNKRRQLVENSGQASGRSERNKISQSIDYHTGFNLSR